MAMARVNLVLTGLLMLPQVNLLLLLAKCRNASLAYRVLQKVIPTTDCTDERIRGTRPSSEKKSVGHV